jgi:hypothetical protein
MPGALCRPSSRERRDVSAREALVRRVCGEFAEMPCLRLTHAQAQRLFGLRPDICHRVLGSLVRCGTLTLGSDERYRLNDTSTWPTETRLGRPRQAVLARTG